MTAPHSLRTAPRGPLVPRARVAVCLNVELTNGLPLACIPSTWTAGACLAAVLNISSKLTFWKKLLGGYRHSCRVRSHHCSYVDIEIQFFDACYNTSPTPSLDLQQPRGRRCDRADTLDTWKLGVVTTRSRSLAQKLDDLRAEEIGWARGGTSGALPHLPAMGAHHSYYVFKDVTTQKVRLKQPLRPPATSPHGRHHRGCARARCEPALARIPS